MFDENYRLVQNDICEKNRDIFLHPVIEDIVHAVEVAVDKDINPTIIPQGSSGSYFVRNCNEEIIGVFKPKDEEPYEIQNPKWSKYFHRVCCPCCFGRKCLISNHGYLSEVGASLIDEKLQLHIVPTTRLASITSTTFNHNALNIVKSKTKTHIAETFPDIGRKFHRLGVPPKSGSLQLFVSGYDSADSCIENLLNGILATDLDLYEEFLFDFQKLVVLDYVIRNTDRNNSNWLVKWRHTTIDVGVVIDDVGSGDMANGGGGSVSGGGGQSCSKNGVALKIAAIDNGLAFPYKHPDQMRIYPYYWSWLSIANVPFSDRICELVLPKLGESHFIEKMIDDLQLLFKVNSHYKRSTFERQMGVMRGQITNLCAALRQKKSPAQLVEMAPMTLELISNSESFCPSTDRLHSTSSDNSTRKQHIFNYVTKYWKRPFFRKF